ncbi:MAG TPA: prenyltransferase [Pseudomonadales bacterium]|nr:prenyltransferase [Pseudomonadales bacterium]
MPRLSAAEWPTLPAITRYFIMVRAAVLVMTVVSVLVGVLMAAVDGAFHLDRLIALLVGLVAAHATNNLINDYIDSEQGLDTDNYLRRRYGVHVLQEGLVSRARFLWAVVATGAAAVAAGVWLTISLGSDVGWLMAAGAFFVLFYTWPLKHFALGEVSVLLVWGPLMTAGSYYVMTGTMTWHALVIACVYGIGPTLVILGKHIDKLDQDKLKGVRSLPVVLGEKWSRYLTLTLVALQWLAIVAIYLAGMGTAWFALLLISVPGLYSMVRAFMASRPEQKPEHFPDSIWPLWFSAFAFRFTRDFGGLLVLAVALQLLTAD